MLLLCLFLLQLFDQEGLLQQGLVAMTAPLLSLAIFSKHDIWMPVAAVSFWGTSNGQG